VLGRFAGEVDLNEDLCGRVFVTGRPFETLEQRAAVDGVDPGHRDDSSPCLVGLKMPDQMPGDFEVFRLLNLVERFLHPVFPEVGQASLDPRPHIVHWERLRDANETDRSRVTPRSIARGGDPFSDDADVRRDCLDEVAGDRHRPRRSKASCAWSAYSPLPSS
jgi:hypothetical protein